MPWPWRISCRRAGERLRPRMGAARHVVARETAATRQRHHPRVAVVADQAAVVGSHRTGVAVFQQGGDIAAGARCEQRHRHRGAPRRSPTAALRSGAGGELGGPHRELSGSEGIIFHQLEARGPHRADHVAPPPPPRRVSCSDGRRAGSSRPPAPPIRRPASCAGEWPPGTPWRRQSCCRRRAPEGCEFGGRGPRGTMHRTGGGRQVIAVAAVQLRLEAPRVVP